MYQGVTPTPDRVFVRKLKEFDPRLSVEFSREDHRFVITRDAVCPGDAGYRAYKLWVVETAAGNFRQPDERDIYALWLGDLWRHGGVKARIMEGEAEILRRHEKEEKDIDQEFHDITKDNKRQLINTFKKASGEGKYGGEFRRIKVKNKGKTWSEIAAEDKYTVIDKRKIK